MVVMRIVPPPATTQGPAETGRQPGHPFCSVPEPLLPSDVVDPSSPQTERRSDDAQAKCHARFEALFQQLLADCTPGAADEALLVKMTSDAAATLSLIDEAHVLVTVAIHRHLDDPRALLNLTSALQRLTAIGNGLSHRVDLSLGTAASLRAQRRLLKAKVSSR